MSIWQDILNAAAAADDGTAEYELHRLSWELRYRRINMTPEDPAYDGPIPKAVLGFVRSLSEGNRRMALSRIDDLVDSITDEILAKIKRTSDLVIFSTRFPQLDCQEVARDFTGWSDLKRSQDDRVKWIKEHLRSMIEIGIPLSPGSIAVDESKAFVPERYLGFEERALVKGWDVNKSWQRFKRQNELSDEYLGIEVDGADERVASEAVDFGIISESKLLPIDRVPSRKTDLELRELGAMISKELNGILNEVHQDNPTAGFPPIAWHKVWWYFTDKYTGLQLRLQLEEPCCETDQALAERIVAHYNGYVGINRLSVQRRRTQLSESCEAALIPAVLGSIG
jgi:hypothetical protein